jgi:hypothetical protein
MRMRALNRTENIPVCIDCGQHPQREYFRCWGMPRDLATTVMRRLVTMIRLVIGSQIQ